jgi:hypothetical protein
MVRCDFDVVILIFECVCVWEIVGSQFLLGPSGMVGKVWESVGIVGKVWELALIPSHIRRTHTISARNSLLMSKSKRDLWVLSFPETAPSHIHCD